MPTRVIARVVQPRSDRGPSAGFVRARLSRRREWLELLAWGLRPEPASSAVAWRSPEALEALEALDTRRRSLLGSFSHSARNLHLPGAT